MHSIPLPGFNHSEMSWSNDGTKLVVKAVFSELIDPNTTAYWGAIYLVDVNSGSSELLREKADAPALSPDGKSFAFVAYIKNIGWNIFLKDFLGTEELPIADLGNKSVLFLTWSPDGRNLVYLVRTISCCPSRFEVRITDVTSGNTNTIPWLDGMEWPAWPEPSIIWSPDGQWFILKSESEPKKDYVAFEDKKPHTYYCTLLQCKEILPPRTEYCETPAWLGPYNP
ncbi:MAG: hypothetical protein QMD04_09265 [Anaerolineales bacterium]|nr:hypothetical protein [Anaerolineales bacterium]